MKNNKIYLLLIFTMIIATGLGANSSFKLCWNKILKSQKIVS